MKLKKTLILFGLLTTIGSSTTPFLASKEQTNNNDVIIVNNEKVNLRQKAVKKANDTSNGANIETTNVDYDLRYLFGGEKNYLKYNIWDLKPTSLDSKDSSFKFICAKPVGTNLYLYVYHNDNRNGDILSGTFKISKSKTQNSETGEFEEQFSLYNARFINSYGYKQRFIKFAIDNIINTTEDVRCFIENGYITYQDPSTTKKYYSNTYEIHDEFTFGLNNGDYMYEYFKDDYVKITDGEVSMLLTKIDDSKHFNLNGVLVNNYSDWAEDFYYFFTTNHEIDDLIEIQYDYYLTSYTHYNDYETRKKATDLSFTWHTYIGLYENANITNESIDFKANNRITKGNTTTDYTRPYFLWWSKEYTYQLENIQDCLDTSNLSEKENEGFLNFINEVQEKRTSENKSKYQWAFRVGSYLRTSNYGFRKDNWSWLLGDIVTSNTYCHEIKQALITWLKFRTNNVEFEFNVLDVPKDTTSIYIQNVPYETLGDVIVNKTLSGWDWLKNAFNNIKNNLVPMLISLAVILVIVACWPVITSFTRLVGSSINMLTDKKTKNKKNNKKKGG